MTEFLILFIANLSLILWIIRWRGLVSCEGLGMAFLAIGIASDGFGLIGASLFDSIRPEAALRMQAEIVPTAIHILGIVCLVIGMSITNLKAARIQYQLTRRDKGNLAFVGWSIVATGLCMKILAMHLMGFSNIFSYLDQLYDYDISVRKYGFLDQGVTFALFGIMLIVISDEGRSLKQCLLLMGAFVISFLLSTSKSGFMLVIIPFYLITRSMSIQTLKYWSRWPILVIVGIIFIVGLGIKTQAKYSGLAEIDYTPGNVVNIAQTTILLRFSSSGLYEGYTNLVNRIIDNPANQLNGTVIIDGIILGNIPRFIFNDFFFIEKPDHPFRAKGELINTDYRVDPDGNDAPTLVGFAFADFAFWSLITYMILGGMILGVIRRFSTSRRNNVIVFVGYIFFASNFGPSLPEGGFLNMFYYITWGIILAIFAWSLIKIRTMLCVCVTSNCIESTLIAKSI